MKEKTALIVIDVQQGFDHQKWGKRNNLFAEERMSKVLQFARKENWEIVHVQHASNSLDSLLHPSNLGFQLKSYVQPQKGEKLIAKHVNSAFIGTDLEQFLLQKQIKNVVIIGLTTPHCVSTTVRMSANLGFQTWLVEDATAAFELYDHRGKRFSAEEVHASAIATLHDEFATIVTSTELFGRFL